ncbi:Mitochondrial thiamine pyrophosphate carrier 1 [Golovinomyces cichoracearum]|uniref:Mitochondrial thiamine pyrophosphate carrier 1 n=1 Tax=Golovinomyces cichoracearum TaxID=62708 RepID=A0A420ICD8_9PEZI|nr:Mitochondrial thiamine pyrophosphate carrier 1 [Golovinomyces cichoracearum]
MYSSAEYLKDEKATGLTFHEGSKIQVIIAGAIAGMTARLDYLFLPTTLSANLGRFVIAPLDVIKIRLQLQTGPFFKNSSFHSLGSTIDKGALSTLQNLLRNEGITALWKGNVPAELMYISYSAIQFTTYRASSVALQKVFGEHQLSKLSETFIAGACAGATATTATYPLDLLRTRLAAQGTERVYRSLNHAIYQIYRSEGMHGFFRGLGAGVAQIVPYMGIFFSVYESLRLPLSTLHLPFGTGDASAGVLASVLAKSCVFPFDLIRKRLQVQGPTRLRYVHKDIPDYKGILTTFQKIMRTEGTRGLYRGLTVSLLKAAPTGAITMWTYERVLKVLMKLDSVYDETK